MTYFPYTVTAPMVDVQKAYPYLSKVKLTSDFIREYCGIWKPYVAQLSEVEWTVTQYYYLIGSRKKTCGGVLVSVPYNDWATLAPKLGVVPYISSSSIPKKTNLSIKDAIGYATKPFAIMLKIYEDEKESSWPSLLIADWNGEAYNEVYVPDLIIDGAPGEMF